MVEFAINNAYHESIRTTPFMMNYGVHPLTPTSFRMRTSSKVPAAQKFTEHMQQIIADAKHHLQAAQQRQKVYADQNRTNTTFKKGDKVLLSTANIKLKAIGTHKLLPKYIGPFEILSEINPVAFKLRLPKSLKIHDIFHASLLAHYKAGGNVKPPPLPEVIEDEIQYEVEAILDCRDRKRGKCTVREYLVKWMNYGPEHNTWEPEKHITNCDEMLAEFWKTRAHKTKFETPPAKAGVRTRKRKPQ
jgi:hypothetical protein